MEIEEVKQLLDKFYQGETSLEEELFLEEFLLSTQLGKEWNSEVELFAHRRLVRLSKGKKPETGYLSRPIPRPISRHAEGLGLEKAEPGQEALDRSRIRLEKSIDAWAESEETQRKHRWKHIYRMSGGIAAAIVLGIGIYTWNGMGRGAGKDMGMADSGKPMVEGSGFLSEQIASLGLTDTYSDPQMAWEKAQQVLGEFASAMKKGEEGMKVIGEKNRRVQEKLDKTMNF